LAITDGMSKAITSKTAIRWNKRLSSADIGDDLLSPPPGGMLVTLRSGCLGSWPTGDAVMCSGDRLMAVGTSEDLTRLRHGEASVFNHLHLLFVVVVASSGREVVEPVDLLGTQLDAVGGGVLLEARDPLGPGYGRDVISAS
jgi:hypothetical protein